MAIEKLKSHKSPGIDQILAFFLKKGVEQFAVRSINVLLQFGIRRNCLRRGRSRLLCLCIRRAIKEIVLFNRGRAAITKLNSILWDRDVTPKTKTHIYHAVVKSTITYAAETWCLKAKTVAKLNSTEMDFWRHSARISRKEKIRNNVIKQKMNVTRSLLEDIKSKQLKWYGHVQRMEEGRLPKEVMKWSPPGRRKRGRPKLT